ncbi:hypothetical protein MDAP_001874 [Mitosporidium daphniae]
MLFYTLFVIALSVSGSLASKSAVLRSTYPKNEIDPEFCVQRTEGYYCHPSHAENIISCPDNTLKPCPNGRSCSSIGKVPSCYFCETPIDFDLFCKERVGGLFCLPPTNGAFKHVVECSGYKFIRLIECPEGSVCYSPPGKFMQAMCLIGEDSFCSHARSAERFPASLTLESIGSILAKPTKSIGRNDMNRISTLNTDNQIITPTSSNCDKYTATVTATLTITMAE